MAAFVGIRTLLQNCFVAKAAVLDPDMPALNRFLAKKSAADSADAILGLQKALLRKLEAEQTQLKAQKRQLEARKRNLEAQLKQRTADSTPLLAEASIRA